MKPMYTLGIDVGSSSSKAVILENGKHIISHAVVEIGTGSTGPERVLEDVFSGTGLGLDDMAHIIATGYGRFNVDCAKGEVSEITCHAKGALFECPGTTTILDIGGQDVKAIKLNTQGLVMQFAMNDKCAAGTGRFLDVMSKVLEIPMSDMGDWYFKSKHPAPVSSTCTVFAESEVISLLSKNVPKEDIVAGVHRSIASKASALVRRVGVGPDLTMTGGGSRDAGVVDAISKELGIPVNVALHPQVVGALGAALIAYDKVTK